MGPVKPGNRLHARTGANSHKINFILEDEGNKS
jgi:hypothetical protein